MLDHPYLSTTQCCELELDVAQAPQIGAGASRAGRVGATAHRTGRLRRLISWLANRGANRSRSIDRAQSTFGLYSMRSKLQLPRRVVLGRVADRHFPNTSLQIQPLGVQSPRLNLNRPGITRTDSGGD